MRGDEDQDEDESAAPGHSTGLALELDASVHAQALLQGNYGIIHSQDKRKGTTSWLVRLRRDGRRVGTHYFYHHHYDSPDVALAAARAYRNALLGAISAADQPRAPPAAQQTQRQRGAGVSRDTDGPGYWIASTKLANGTVLFKRFSSRRMASTRLKNWPFGSASASYSM